MSQTSPIIPLAPDERVVPVEHSVVGGLAAWERGGAHDVNRGEATVIAGPNGEMKRALNVLAHYVPNDKHALLPIAAGDFVIQASYYMGDYSMWVGRVTSFVGADVHGAEKTFAKIKVLHCFERNAWDSEPPETLAAALKAATDESQEPDCRHPFYCVTRHRA